MPPRRTRGRGAALAVVVVALAALVVPVGGAGASTTGSRARGVVASYRDTVDAVIADLQDFWATEFRRVYGIRYTPIPRDRIVAARPGAKIPRCQGEKVRYRDVEDNALYCFVSNFIVYDDVELMPGLYDSFGPFAVGLVLAHEWGHGIQDRIDLEQTDVPSVYTELQADCFAGAWTADVAEDDKTDVPYEPADLDTAVAALINVRDAPGSSPSDPAAHGSAFDRLSAFQDGFRNGSTRCAAYVDEPPLIVQVPFSSPAEAASGGNVDRDEVIPLSVELLNEFYGLIEPGYEPITLDLVRSFDSRRVRTIPRCGGSRPSLKTVQNRVYYCIDDGYIAYDEPFLRRVYEEIGDFGVATLLANPFATYVQIRQGIPGAEENTAEAVMQADCYTGGWVAAFFNGFLSGSLSSGDLDEFVQAYLAYSKARGVTADVPITFIRVDFFRRGFLEGYNSCDYDAIAAEVARL